MRLRLINVSTFQLLLPSIKSINILDKANNTIDFSLKPVMGQRESGDQMWQYFPNWDRCSCHGEALEVYVCLE